MKAASASSGWAESTETWECLAGAIRVTPPSLLALRAVLGATAGACWLCLHAEELWASFFSLSLPKMPVVWCRSCSMGPSVTPLIKTGTGEEGDGSWAGV